MGNQKIKRSLLKAYNIFYGCCRFVAVTMIGEKAVKDGASI